MIRRSRFELNKSEARAHILEGLKKAIDHIYAIIATIKASKTPKEAKDRLMEKFAFSDEQAQAILEMRLQRLTNLEQRKIVDEYEETISESPPGRPCTAAGKIRRGALHPLDNLRPDLGQLIQKGCNDSRRGAVSYPSILRQNRAGP